MSTYKLTAKRRALATHEVAFRYRVLRDRLGSQPLESPADTLARAAAQIAQERPHDFAHAVRRMSLGDVRSMDLWSDKARVFRTWARREALVDVARREYLADLFGAQPPRIIDPASSAWSAQP